MRQGDRLVPRMVFMLRQSWLGRCSLEIQDSFPGDPLDCSRPCGTPPTIHSPCACDRVGTTSDPQRRGVASSSGCRKLLALLRILFAARFPPNQSGVNRHTIGPASLGTARICSNPIARRSIAFRWAGSRGAKVAATESMARGFLTHAVTRGQSVILLPDRDHSSALDHNQDRSGPESASRFIGTHALSQVILRTAASSADIWDHQARACGRLGPLVPRQTLRHRLARVFDRSLFGRRLRQQAAHGQGAASACL